jgi:hypothetical protein
MKQVLFFLLVFISFKGVAQSVKVEEIGLEVMTKDLGDMDWKKAKKACKKLGDGWRLPTIEELKKIYKYKDFIGGFEDSLYWSSTEYDNDFAWFLKFSSGSDYYGRKDGDPYVRAVRTLK